MYKIISLTPFDFLNNITQFTYDAAHRLTKLTDPLLRETQFTYDPNGNRTSTTDPLSNLTSSNYNARNQNIQTTDANLKAINTTYNSHNETLSITNRRNKTYTFNYDKTGNQTTQATPSNKTTTRIWNDRNLLQSIQEPSTNLTTFTYDNQGRILTQLDTVGSITFNYDDNSNPLTITQNGQSITRAYDALNRVTEYIDTRDNTIKYAYDKNNNLTKLTYPGLPLKEVNYTYDAHNRLKTVTDWNSRITTYTWDKESRLTDIVRPNNTTRHLEYDAAGQLLKIEERDANNILIAYYKYGYDNGGRITSRFALPKTKAPIAPLNTIIYDDDNRIATYNGAAVTHDADGNMVTGPDAVGSNVTYTYDTRNRLTAIGNQTYQYDAENNRISATENTQTTNYVINPNAALSQVLIKEKPTGEKTFYVYGIGLLYEVDESENTKTYHFNNTGSTIAITDNTATVTDRIQYSPYGAVIHREGTTETPFLFVGRLGVQTDSNGLLNMRARYYNPTIRRFINADPIGFAGGMNWYAYANGNPVTFFDPEGTTFRSNANFLLDFFTGGGETNRTYTASDVELIEIQQSVGAEKLRTEFAKNQNQSIGNISYSTVDAFVDTILDPATSDLSSTATQVGGFIRGSAVNNGDGTVTYTIPNVAGANSFFYHSATDRSQNATGPFRSINQTFQFTEPIFPTIKNLSSAFNFSNGINFDQNLNSSGGGIK